MCSNCYVEALIYILSALPNPYVLTTKSQNFHTPDFAPLGDKYIPTISFSLTHLVLPGRFLWGPHSFHPLIFGPKTFMSSLGIRVCTAQYTADSMTTKLPRIRGINGFSPLYLYLTEFCFRYRFFLCQWCSLVECRINVVCSLFITLIKKIKKRNPPQTNKPNYGRSRNIIW